ncbi:uroporphyrin-III C-methyltransferase [Ardenticatena maritima]|uniref:uroporphyrinogen-III C-methyltransferase n=1 Tax=Ardenticatena maritima TaxID=872965 RepID=A0A0M8K663_9CHLR|nr:uroporphyrinogen-III C-methyltransferase [Ardenticatena maritima]KPL87580.1 CobA protein [Ardenticatena maritima]GAP62593.1 uroporphyrin-III C-methyltransferase [Ardenticatena maritima]
MSGKVYLVGAGPGAADLITLRGLRALQRADVVLYDRLIAPELLDEAPPHAERIFVGKAASRHTMPQDAINALLVERARAGQQVVRLKGGDPFVFGRGGEEMLALLEAGVPFEVVPGVSSAIAVPALAGIPVTHRDVASGFAVVAGHETPDKAASSLDWSALARIPTLVVLMARKNIAAICTALLSAGRAPDTPAAAISAGGTPHEQVVAATLATLAQAVEAADMPTPMLVIVGEVVHLMPSCATNRFSR